MQKKKIQKKKQKNTKITILAIETSCDETSLAVLDVVENKTTTNFKVRAHETASQAQFHAQYGGVFPAMAKREHTRAMMPLFLHTLKKAKIARANSKSQILNSKKISEILNREPDLLEQFLKEIPKIQKPPITHIAVTVGPGLEPTLWVGINFAKALSLAWDIPIIPVNHMHGHILSVLVPPKKKSFKLKAKNLNLTAVSLLVSGGHTELVLVKGIGKYKKIGQTRDDAAGEAFDKVARMLALPYPGGPEISRIAEISRNDPYLKKSRVPQEEFLPRPMLRSPDFDFSFSGLKTAVLYLIRDLTSQTEAATGTAQLSDITKEMIAREFEDAVVEVLTTKSLRALKKYKAKTLIVGGGVAANKQLRKKLTQMCKKEKIAVHFPTGELSTDNALMIALAGYFNIKNAVTKQNSPKLVASGNLQI